MWDALYHGILSWAKAQKPSSPIAGGLQFTVETDQILIIRRRTGLDFCPECGQLVEMVSLEDATAILGMASPTPGLFQLDRKLHVCERTQGRLVCLESLLKSLKMRGPQDNSVFGIGCRRH